MTHYQTLGVEPTATADEIKAAYRRAARDAHPDRSGGDTEKMAKVNRAYQVLGDPEARARYDECGEEPGARNDPGIAVLLQLFERAIAECDGDILAFCHRELDTAISALEGDARSADRKIAKLKTKRDRLKVKSGGENLFTQLIDAKVAEQEAQLSSIEGGRKSAAMAKDHLATYESTFVPERENGTAREIRSKAEAMNMMMDEMLRAQFGFGAGNRGGRPW